MSDHQLPANRQAVLDYIAALIKNPQLDDEQVFGSLGGLLNGLVKSNQHREIVVSSSQQEHNNMPPTPASKTRSRRGDSFYVKGLLGPLKDFLHPDADIDRNTGLSCEEIRERLFDLDQITRSITADNIKRVLVANQRHFQKLANGNWRPRSKMKVERSAKRLLESKNTDEQYN